MTVLDNPQPTFDESELPSTLNLLAPWDLPNDCSLPESLRQVVADTLSNLQKGLESNDIDADNIDRLLVALPPQKTPTHRPDKTNTPLSTDEVEEYNKYFKIKHVDSDIPALTILSSLLQSCQVFTALCASTVDFDAEQIELQRRGYLTYIDLLRRVFGLDGEA